jgi:hypothetical protein
LEFWSFIRHSDFVIRQLPLFPEQPERLESRPGAQSWLRREATSRAVDPETACSASECSYPGGRVAPQIPQSLAQRTEPQLGSIEICSDLRPFPISKSQVPHLKQIRVSKFEIQNEVHVASGSFEFGFLNLDFI